MESLEIKETFISIIDDLTEFIFSHVFKITIKIKNKQKTNGKYS